MAIRNQGTLSTLFVLALAVILTFGVFAPRTADAETNLSLATSPPGGSWYPMAAGLAELFNKELDDVNVTVDGTGGGSTNPKLLAAGKVEMALTTLDMVFSARKGDRPYAHEYDLSKARSIMLQHSSPGHIVVREDSDIHNITDLKGKSIAIGERGAAGNTRSLWYLQVAGLTADDVTLQYIGDEQAADALADRRIDAWIEFVGVPAPAVLNLATTTDIRLINLTEQQRAELKKKWPFMVPTLIPAGTYDSQDNDYTGFGVTGCLMVTTVVPEDVVYRMCKAIDGNWNYLYGVHKGFKLWKFAPDTEEVSGQPLHPGAMKFYKEKGLIK